MESRTQDSRPRTQKNFGANDRPSRGQGHRRKCSKKKGFQKNFSSHLKKRSSKIFFRQKRSSKVFFRQFLLEENKKRSSQIFCEVSGAFQQNFNSSKNSAASSRGQVNFRGFEAKDFKMCPRGQGRVLKDSTSANYAVTSNAL